MSTKNTITFGSDYYVYSELCEENQSVYLQLDGVDLEFEVFPNRITVRIPKRIMKDILDHSDKINERLDSTCDWED
jgi:hypothetical protein